MSADDASAALSEVRSTLLVVGTNGPQGPHFMVANWGTQASFDPWRYVLALKAASHTRGFVDSTRAFTVNLLDAPKRDVVERIMRSRGDGHAGYAGPTGAPRLPESYAGFDCKLLDVVDTGGDHVLVVADVVDGWKKEGGPALTVGEAKLSYAG